MALGGMTDGVYCSEVTAAYQIFGNGGFYNEPYTCLLYTSDAADD